MNRKTLGLGFGMLAAVGLAASLRVTVRSPVAPAEAQAPPLPGYVWCSDGWTSRERFVFPGLSNDYYAPKRATSTSTSSLVCGKGDGTLWVLSVVNDIATSQVLVRPSLPEAQVSGPAPIPGFVSCNAGWTSVESILRIDLKTRFIKTFFVPKRMTEVGNAMLCRKGDGTIWVLSGKESVTGVLTMAQVSLPEIPFPGQATSPGYAECGASWTSAEGIVRSQTELYVPRRIAGNATSCRKSDGTIWVLAGQGASTGPLVMVQVALPEVSF